MNIKKKTLSKSDEFYIEQNFTSLSVEKLSEDTNTEIDVVKKKFEQCRAAKKQNPLFGRREGVTVMTKAASEQGDDFSKETPKKNKDSRADKDSRIHIIHPGRKISWVNYARPLMNL